ncbi:MAG: CPBP family intramembrane metalloprotease [Candidatus Eisenbacteria bacterium]|uniref:CPBP family intramembrane metalloprotease n=1 Tax=Eiseniibacteriota bacterium TaxID=2212470 RepID=A0A7Y2H3A6_UNCEI|nr:CPBP family intramembrane metalloprotease [Candidatus Eisenbacteria bacterium]
MIGFSWSQVFLVWRKELLDIIRDRRTIMAMIIVPLLVYPILIIGVSQVGIRQVEKIRARMGTVAIIPENMTSELGRVISADSTLQVLHIEDAEEALQDGSVDALLLVPNDFEEKLHDQQSMYLTLRADMSNDQGREVLERVQGILVDWRKEIVVERLEEEGVPPDLAEPFLISSENSAGARKMGGSLMGQILPVLLVVMMMTGALYPAIDVTAGERERGTLETLLVSPSSRFALVLGKYLTVFTASMVTTLANLISMAFTVFYLLGSAKVAGADGLGISGLMDWRAFFAVLALMIPMALFFCALAMLVASFARSYKEAQNYLSPLLIACLTPTYLGLLPGFEINYNISLIPVANVVLLAREFFLGNYPWNYFMVSAATLSGFAIIMLHQTAELFSQESVLGGASSGGKISWRALIRKEATARKEVLQLSQIGPVFAMVLLGFFYIGSPLQLQNVRLGLVITQILVIAGIPILALRMMRIDVVETLRLQNPGFAKPAFALLIWPAATLLAALAASLQGLVIEVPESYRAMMERLVASEMNGNILVAVLIFAVVPGICEEILFRGFVLRGLLGRMKPAQAIFWTAVVFGAFHFDIYRFVPTTVLGLILGWVTYKTGRLWPAMVIHIANNAFAVIASNLSSYSGLEWLRDGGDVPLGVILGVIAISGFGVYGLLRASAAPKPTPATDPPV